MIWHQPSQAQSMSPVSVCHPGHLNPSSENSWHYNSIDSKALQILMWFCQCVILCFIRPSLRLLYCRLQVQLTKKEDKIPSSLISVARHGGQGPSSLHQLRNLAKATPHKNENKIYLASYDYFSDNELRGTRHSPPIPPIVEKSIKKKYFLILIQQSIF